ncbi:MAG: NUDIX hydrolase [Candidatus Paceibacter sp.]|nr:NUDIX hydrolase [Candidatus Paceibacter sp.]
MEIKSKLRRHNEQVFDVVYKEDDYLNNIEGKNLEAVHAFCFYKEKLIVVYADNKGYWAPPGGGIEKNETVEKAVEREVKEETNMKILHQEVIGYQDIYEPGKIIRQTRSFCLVEPYGEFVADPDGDITEIKFIDPKDYKKYFDWGEIGERIMQRAIELKNKFSSLSTCSK